jgi:hypothetical protein
MPSTASSLGRAVTLILEESRGDGSETLPSGSWPRSWHLRDWTGLLQVEGHSMDGWVPI